MDLFSVLLACRAGTNDTAEPAIRHDDQMFAFLVVTEFGAGGTAGDDLADALPHVLKP